MISHTVYRTFDTPRRREFIRITDDVAGVVRESAVTEGMVPPHHQVIVPMTDGALDLGPWQQIFYCEFDGGRRKRMVIKVLGE